MKVKELIEELKKFDENMEVQYDCEDNYSTFPIDGVSIEYEHYESDRKKVVVIY